MIEENKAELVGIPSSLYTELYSTRIHCKDMYNLTKSYFDARLASVSPYVPKFKNENPETYAARLGYAFTVNMLAEAIDGATGRLADNYEIVIDEIKSPEIKEWCKDLTGTGISIESAALALYFYLWLYGSAPWFINYTQYKTENGEGQPAEGNHSVLMTKQQKKALSPRPYLEIFNPLDMIEAFPININGVQHPGRIRIKTAFKSFSPEYDLGLASEPDLTNYKENDVTLVRVFTYQGYQFYYQTDSDDWKEGGIFDWDKSYGLLFGCLTFPGQEHFYMARPPFEDVAILQALCIAAESDSAVITSVAQLPFLFAPGLATTFKNQSVAIGAATVITGPTGSDLRYVEVKGTSIEAGIRRIERLIKYAQTISGLQFAGQADGVATATSQILSTAGMTGYSSLAIQYLEDNLNKILKFMALRAGITGDIGEVKIEKKGEVVKTTEVQPNGDQRDQSIEPTKKAAPGNVVEAFQQSIEDQVGV